MASERRRSISPPTRSMDFTIPRPTDRHVGDGPEAMRRSRVRRPPGARRCTSNSSGVIGISSRPSLRHETGKSPTRGRIAESTWFDAEWYRSVYPEARASGLSPELDFVRDGVARGRDPGPGFSLSRYLADNPDVAASGINPLLHFIDHGEAEDRPHAPAEEPDGCYLRWIREHDTLSEGDRAAIRTRIARLRQRPTISGRHAGLRSYGRPSPRGDRLRARTALPALATLHRR